MIISILRWLDPPMAEGQKWRTLEHKGPLFPPTYKPLPPSVHLLYDGMVYFLFPLSLSLSLAAKWQERTAVWNGLSKCAFMFINISCVI